MLSGLKKRACVFNTAKFRSRCLKINPVIKLPASAASPMTKGQGSPRPPPSACRAVVRGLSCILVIGEAALAADLITGLIFKHFERNLAAQTASRGGFRLMWPR